MFGMGMPEILLILAIALIVIGPKKLPDLAKAMGRALGEFKRATNDLKASIDLDPGIRDVKNAFNEVNTDIKDGILSDPAPDSGKGPDTPPNGSEGAAAGTGPGKADAGDGYGEALETVRQAFHDPGKEKFPGGGERAPSEKGGSAGTQAADKPES